MAVKEAQVELDQKTLGMLLRTFTYLYDYYDDPKVWDHAEQMIDSDDVKSVLDALGPHAASGHEPVVIPMNFGIWTYYIGLLRCARKVPVLQQADYELINDLMEKYSEMDDAGLAPTGP